MDFFYKVAAKLANGLAGIPPGGHNSVSPEAVKKFVGILVKSFIGLLPLFPLVMTGLMRVKLGDLSSWTKTVSNVMGVNGKGGGN